jgi:FkbM family methyltransferase
MDNATDSNNQPSWQTTNLIDSIVTRYGVMKFFTHDCGALTKSLIEYGEWAQNEIAFLLHFIYPGSVVIDAGAYIGTHALAFSKLVGPNGKVYAIEAQANSYTILKENVRLNNATNIVAINAIIADQCLSERAINEIEIENDASFGSATVNGIVSERHGQRSGCRKTTVPSIRLDDLDLPSCALVKIDVEGMESDVLVGSSKLITTYKPVIYAECNCVEDGAKTLSKFHEYGYIAFIHIVNAFNSENFRRSEINIFGFGKEVALIGIPQDRRDDLTSIHPQIHEIIFEISTLDDLVAGMLLKPQYSGEVLQHTNALQVADIWDAVENAKGKHPLRKQLDAAYAENKQLIDAGAQARVVAAHSEQQLQETRKALERTLDELSSLLNSNSWTITRPLRAVRRYMSAIRWH